MLEVGKCSKEHAAGLIKWDLESWQDRKGALQYIMFLEKVIF